MADSITLEVVTPAQAVLDIKVKEVVLPGIQGQLGVLPGHLPLLTSLDIGPMTVVDTDNKKRTFYVDGGFAKVLRHKVTVLTEACSGLKEIDISHARLLLEEAQTEMTALEERAKNEQITPDVYQMHQKRLKRAQQQLLIGEGKED